MADLIIRNGTVVDGTGRAGRARRRRGHRRRRSPRSARSTSRVGAREIDADGAVVTPGFVDIHTHFDGQVTWDPIVAPSSLHGVTTIAMGNCGVGLRAGARRSHDWLIGLLEGVEDIPGTALAEGLTWDWESFPEYLDAVDGDAAHRRHGRARPARRAAHLRDGRPRRRPHRGADRRRARRAWRACVREALDAGAIGFATSRTDVHRTKDGAAHRHAHRVRGGAARDRRRDARARAAASPS